MNQTQTLKTHNDPRIYRMSKGLQRMQVIFLSAMAIFSLGMIIAFYVRGENSPLEYLIFVAAAIFWAYALWYSLSARLLISSKDIEFRAAIRRVYAKWDQIDHLGIEPTGPTLFVQESNQVGEKAKKSKIKKIPLFLFVEKWKDKSEWETDPVGRDLISCYPRLLEGKF